MAGAHGDAVDGWESAAVRTVVGDESPVDRPASRRDHISVATRGLLGGGRRRPLAAATTAAVFSGLVQHGEAMLLVPLAIDPLPVLGVWLGILICLPLACKIRHIIQTQVNKIRNADIWGAGEVNVDDDDDDDEM
mmetsp:Transcript_21218/g.51174  ORF Transcript_21218/g.51174 Transcript_21218/m.51174 type:complete len:135 (+) Transcript_21218:175-579(+)